MAEKLNARRTTSATNSVGSMIIKASYKAMETFGKFVLHFFLVMGLLIAGACVFIKLEENNLPNTNIQYINLSKSIDDLQRKHKINLNDTIKMQQFVKDVLMVVQNNCRTESHNMREEKKNYYDLFRRWFYFTNILSTTIGYGDIAPTSQEGRLFLIPYTIIAIPAMMTLLARCGDVLTSANRKLFKVIQKYCCQKKQYVSEALFSTISITLVLCCYIQIGPILTVMISMENWTYIDSVYYWFVTFSTIGFGDIQYTIDDHEYVILIYRLFGLALLAGVINSLIAWLKERKEYLENLDKRQLLSRIRLTSSTFNISEISMNRLRDVEFKNKPKRFCFWKSRVRKLHREDSTFEGYPGMYIAEAVINNPAVDIVITSACDVDN